MPGCPSWCIFTQTDFTDCINIIIMKYSYHNNIIHFELLFLGAVRVDYRVLFWSVSQN